MNLNFLFAIVLVVCVTGSVNVFWIGNSYTQGNDLANLVASMGKERGDIMNVTKHLHGGWNLTNHSKQTIVIDNLKKKWDYVILQDHSLHPGFLPRREETIRAIKGFYQPNRMRSGSNVMFYETWGRRRGIQGHANFKAMQSLTSQGYRAYKTAIESSQYKTVIAPVGTAWERLFDNTVRSGKDPLNPASLFSRLYLSDDSHPSVHGSYLTACVFYKSIFKKSPQGIQFVLPGITPAERAELQKLADF